MSGERERGGECRRAVCRLILVLFLFRFCAPSWASERKPPPESVRADPAREEAEALYQKGISLAASGDPAKALGFFERAAAMAPSLAAESHRRMAEAYDGLGFPGKAREERAVAETIAGETASGEGVPFAPPVPRRFSLGPRLVYANASAGYEYDSNVTLHPHGGDDVAVSGKGDFRFFTSATTLVEVARTAHWSLGPSYSFYQSIHNHLGLYNLQEHTVGATLWGAFSIFQPQIAYRYRYAFLDDNRLSFVRTNELSAALSVNERVNLFTRLYYSLTLDDFMISVDDPRDDQDGYTNTAGLEQYLLLFSGRGYASVGFSYDRDSARGDNYLYDGYKFYALASVPLPRRWFLEGQAEYYYRDFSRSTEGREDHRQIYGASLVKSLNSAVDVRFDYLLTLNSSSDSFFSYNRDIFSLSTMIHF